MENSVEKPTRRFRLSRRQTAGDRILLAVFFVISFLFAAACLYPFLLMIVSSFTDEATIIRNGFTLLPAKWSLNAYKAVFSAGTVPTAYQVTIITTVGGTALSLLATSMCAYAISVKALRYRNIIAFIFYFTLLFSGGLVPTYILISKYLHLRNSYWAYILPNLVGPMNIFLMRNFFSTLPESFRESAKMDGAGEMTILFRIVIPLSTPAMATFALFYALGYWNTWMESMLYMDSSKMYTLQYLIMQIMRNLTAATTIAKQASIPMPVPPAHTIQYATAMLSIGPIIFLYPFLQRYFVAGLRVGGIKG